MKKIILTFGVLALLMSISAPVFAVDPGIVTPSSQSTLGSDATSGQKTVGNTSAGTGSQAAETVTLKSPLNKNLDSVGALLNAGLTIFTYIAVLIAVISFIVVGLQFILARGNASKLEEAKTRLWAIIIGVTIVIGAKLIVSVVINTLSATKVVNDNITNSAKQAISGSKINP